MSARFIRRISAVFGRSSLERGYARMRRWSFPQIVLLLLCFGLLVPASLPAGGAWAAKKPLVRSARQPAYSESFSREQLCSFAFKALQSSYPDFHFKLEKGNLIFPDGSSIAFDDGIAKTPQELLDHPDIFDMFFYRYPSLDSRRHTRSAGGATRTNAREGRLTLPTSIPYLEDPGRVRNELFFRKMYGESEAEVRQHLAPVKWIPSAKGPTLMITTVNGVNKAFQAVSDELDKRPALWPYLLHPGGSFIWRVIAGTDRLSVHSFGAAIDINVARSNYWHYVVKDEAAQIPYKNRIPAAIVDVFERHGFIWGGWWYHYDTMHFEYRPELIAYMHLVQQARMGK